MKKTLLLLCAITCLLNAQAVVKKELKENPFFQQFVKNQQTSDQLMLRSDNPNLPDTIYTYEGEVREFVKREAITYDENGRRKLINGWADVNGDGLINELDYYRQEYTYTQKDDLLEESIQSVFMIDDEWMTTRKSVVVYNKYGNIVGAYDATIDWDNNSLKTDSKLIALESDEKGNAIAMIDSTLERDEWTLMYWEFTYDVQNRYDTIYSYDYNEVEKQKGRPVEKIGFHYNENGNETKSVHYEYDEETGEWAYEHMMEYTYDEKGNRTSEKDIESDGKISSSEYYKNIYSSTVANEEIFTVESAVYPNPVSDVLNVSINGADQAIITLLSANGSIVTQQKVQQLVTSIPVSSLAKGYYYLKVQTAQGAKTHKVIIK